MGTGGSSAKQRKTRKFADVKRMVNPKDMRLSVLLISRDLSPSVSCTTDAGMHRTGKRIRRSRRRRKRQ
jgi:hypothetical protein